MKTPARATVSALLSLVIGLAVTLGLLGYGVTEELPVGNVRGLIVMNENGRPLPGAFVTMTHLAFEDGRSMEDVRTEHHFRADSHGKFQLHHLLSGDYKVTVSTKAHKLEDFPLHVEEGKPTDARLAAIPIDPYLDIYASQRVYMPSEAPHIQLKGFSERDVMKIGLYRLDFNKVVSEGGLYNALAPLARNEDGKAKDPATMGSLLKKIDYTISGRDGEGTFADKLPLPSLSEGLYWVQCNLGPLSRGTWLSVSKIALIAKHSGNDVTAFVTTIDRGRPVTGASIGYGTSEGFTQAGVSGSDGLARFVLPAKTDKKRKADVLVATSGDSRALVDFRRGYEEDSGADTSEDADTGPIRIYTYTDRPLYRPGDLVQFKGMIRVLQGDNYVLPKSGTVTVEMQDESNTVMQTQTLPISAMGTFSGHYQFSTDDLPANYQLVTKYGKATSTKYVGVAAYRKPSYSISVDPEKPAYVRGETVRMAVQAKYYYGAPVVGAKVTARVYREPHWDWSEYGFGSEQDFSNDEADFSPDDVYPGESLRSYRNSGDEETKEVTATTDANGKTVISFPTKGTNESKEAESDFTYNVSVDITDQSDKTFSGQGSVTVLKSDLKLRLDFDNYVQDAGKPIAATASIRDARGQPVPGMQVKLDSGFVTWDRRKEIIVDPYHQVLSTGPNGSVTATINPPGAGFYEVRAEITDARGNAVVRRNEIYLEGAASRYELPGPTTKLNIILDKKSYKAGDTAKALITCGSPGGVALVAIEGSRVYSTQTVSLDREAKVFSFKVTENLAPDAFVSVAYVRNKRYSESSKQLLIDLGKRKLNVSVTADKASYHPGDTAIYHVKTTTPAGQPVKAEVSLGVVDEAVYAIFDDNTDIVKAFYPKRLNDVQTDYSFPELYLGGGDKAPNNIQIRRKFNDTAFWQPSAMTGDDGTATIPVKLPDNLTSWRASAKAITADTQVGQAKSNVVSKKDLMVELSAPTYVVNGDVQRMVAMVTNNTGSDADVKLQIAPEGAKLDGNTDTSLHVANGAMQSVEYKITPERSGQAVFTAKAWITGGASDGVELKLPVKPHAHLVVDGYAGSTKSTQSYDLNLQPGYDPDAGELNISVAPSIGASLSASLDWLIAFPYGCTEQTTSRFLPTVLYAKDAADLGLPPPKFASKVKDIVRESYDRLSNMQHQDGGWGWWEHDASEPYMTAYVLEAVFRAKEAGFDPPSASMVTKASDWGDKHLHGQPWRRLLDWRWWVDSKAPLSDELYLAYALGLHGRTAEAKTMLDAMDLSRLNATESAYAALTANVLGDASKRDLALARMVLQARQTRSTAEWPSEQWYGYESTGRCFMALQTLKPDHPLIPKVVTLLMEKRQGERWYSTRDTAPILVALIDHLKSSKEGAGDSDIEVRLNGNVLKRVHLGKESVLKPETQVRVPVREMAAGANHLEIRAVNGVCYYTVAFKQYVSGNVQPSGPEVFTIQRNYYKLQAERMEDGTLRLQPSHEPVTSFQTGDILRCVLKIHSNAGSSYVLVEDPIPSNCHVTDREEPDESESWMLWWSRTIILDDRVSFFARNVPAGDSTISYVLRAETPGTSISLPATSYNMYDPSENASAPEVALKVNP